MSAHVTRTQKLLMIQYDLFFVPYLIIFGTRFSKVLLSLQAQSNILNKNLETKQLSGLVIIRIFEKWVTEHTNKDSKKKNIWFTQNQNMQVVYSKTHNQALHSWGSCSVSHNPLLYLHLVPFFPRPGACFSKVPVTFRSGTLRSNDATATRTSLKKWICVLSVFIAIIPTHLLGQL